MPHSQLPDPDRDPQFYEDVKVKRLVAFGFDTLLVLLVLIVLAILSVGLLFWIFAPLFMVANVAYRAVTVARSSATLGMSLAGIELRNSDGDTLSRAEALWHAIGVQIAFATVILWPVNAIFIVMTQKGQGLHDLLLGTAAINRPL